MKWTIAMVSCLLLAMNISGQQRPVWGVTPSLPYLNNYCYYDHHALRRTGKSGFVGLGMALFYQKEKNKFSLNSGATADLFAPIGPIDYGKTGQRTAIGSLFLEAIWHRTIFPRINIIGGMNVLQYRYSFFDYDNSISQFNNDNTLGVTLGTEYRFTKTFSIAAFYRPALRSPGVSSYRHLLSMDFRFDISIIGHKEDNDSGFRRRSRQKSGGHRIVWPGRRRIF